MGTQLRLADVEKAISARDPKCVDLLIQIVSAPDAERLNQTAANQPSLATNTPPAEGRYTFADFRAETSSRKFYQQPADVQRQFRTEKISLLESDQADEPLSDRLRSYEIILKLWESDKSFERECLLDLLRRIPLVYGPWKAIKQIFKQAEAQNDTQVLGILAWSFDIASQRRCDVSHRTLRYLSRRAWRYLRNIGKTLPACYADTAVDFLVEYEWPHRSHWVWTHIFYHEEKQYTRTQFKNQYTRLDVAGMMKHRAFPELWQRSPLPLFSLLERANSDLVRSYAATALKTDFRNVIREVEPDWVKRLLSSNNATVQKFAIWVLENAPKFEQSKFRELGLHDAVLRLFNSEHTLALNYVAAYARTHSRDLPIDDLIRLANCNRDGGKGSEAVRKLATDLLRSKDPRKEVGLDNWGLLLETQFANGFAAKALREHFGAKDLTPAWFANRFASDSEQAISFAVKNLLDIHPAKKLGGDYFYDLLLDSFSSTTLVFCLSELEKLGLEQLKPKQLETLLLHPNSQVWSSVLGWVSSGKVAASELDSEFLKSIAFKPTWADTPQVVESLKRQSEQNLVRNSDRSETVYEEAIADHIFGWLSDIRLFSPDEIGFDWLMGLVNRPEPRYHDFAVETMIKGFLPADFAPASDEPASQTDPSNDEINIDFEQATFVFTGKLATMTRSEAQEKVKLANGKNVGTVNKSLGYLVIGDEGSPMYGMGRKGSKQVKAESLRESGAEIRIISETAFLQMLSGTQREFSEDAVIEGCEALWKMFTESPKENTPLAMFAARYLRCHHPEICLAETDRPVDPGAEIPDAFLTFERIKPLLMSGRLSQREFGLELCKWEFARWSPPIDQLIELCESPHVEVRELVSAALLDDDSPQSRRYRLDPETFEADAVYELCQSRDQQVRSIGMKLIERQPRLREPDQLFKLTESPDRAVRAFVIRAFWSLYRERATTDQWKPYLAPESKTAKQKNKKSADEQRQRLGPGSPIRPDQPPAGYAEIQFLLRRMLFEISPGPPPRTTGPSLDNLKLKPIPTRKGKMLLIETVRDLAIQDAAFAKIVLPVLKEFMNSHGLSEHDSCLVAVARIESAHESLKTPEWRDPINNAEMEGAKS